jgi:hypothetical protein
MVNEVVNVQRGLETTAPAVTVADSGKRVQR